MEFIDLRDRVLTLPALEKRVSVLRSEVETAKNDVAELLRKYEKESRDMERIQQDSFSTFLLRLVGKYEDKLEKRQRDEINAKLAYDRAVTHLDNVTLEEKELRTKLTALRAEERIYHNELENRRRKLFNCPGYAEFENEKIAIVTQMTEIEEAIRAVSRTRQTAQKILKSLESAEGWATFDAFTKGGIISHMAKYSHIDEAEKDFNVLSSQLRELKLELADVEGLSVTGFTEISSGQRAVDFWFDNIFTDLSVRRKVIENADEVKRLMGSLSKTDSALKAKLRESESLFSKNRRKEEEFLLAVQ